MAKRVKSLNVFFFLPIKLLDVLDIKKFFVLKDIFWERPVSLAVKKVWILCKQRRITKSKMDSPLKVLIHKLKYTLKCNANRLMPFDSTTHSCLIGVKSTSNVLQIQMITYPMRKQMLQSKNRGRSKLEKWMGIPRLV